MSAHGQGSGAEVRVLDALLPEVHAGGPDQRRAATRAATPEEADLVVVDVQDREVVEAALADVEVVFHQTAVVGLGWT